MSNCNKITAFDSRNIGLRNENLILNLLRQQGELSQSQICRLAGLSSSTASYIIGRLREKKLIVESQGQSNSRGAKPVMISVNPLGRFVIGVEINPTDILIGLFDFNCLLIESISATFGLDRSPENVVSLIEIAIRGILSKHNVTDSMLAGIGLAISGSISKSGVVELSSPMGWKSVPLQSMLQNRFISLVSLHTTRVRLLAEYIIDPSISSKNILYINVGNGVGGHVVIDGHLIHGYENRSGEIGHIILDPNGPTCGCGHKGCLEAYISGPALAKKIRDEVTAASSVLKAMISDSDLPGEIIAKWGLALKQNDPYAIKLRDYVGQKLSQISSIAINCYDPEIIMLAGYVCRQCTDYFVDVIKSRIGSDVFDGCARNITITSARAGDLSLILGAASAVLQNEIEFSP